MRIRGPCEQAERPGGSSPPGRFRGWTSDRPRPRSRGSGNWAIRAGTADPFCEPAAPGRRGKRARRPDPGRPGGLHARAIDAWARSDDRHWVTGRGAPPRAPALDASRAGRSGPRPPGREPRRAAACRSRSSTRCGVASTPTSGFAPQHAPDDLGGEDGPAADRCARYLPPEHDREDPLGAETARHLIHVRVRCRRGKETARFRSLKAPSRINPVVLVLPRQFRESVPPAPDTR